MKRIAVAVVLAAVVAGSVWSQDSEGRTFFRTGGTVSEVPARFEVPVPEGTLVAVLAVSVDFTPVLTIGGPAIAGDSFGQAYGTTFSGNSQTIEVSVAAPDGLGGDYMLRVYEIPLQGTVGPGESVPGFLESNDSRRADGRYVDWYRLSLSAGQAASVLATAGFDTYLYVRGPDGGVLEYDDTEGSDAGTVITASDDSTYLLGVSSFSSGTEGAYTLEIEAASAPERIAVGEVVVGRLDVTESVDRYIVSGDGVLHIRLESEEFDTYLSVEGEDGGISENDDASDGSTDSELVYALSDGAVITVRSFDGSSAGSYRLSVEDVSDAFEVEAVDDGRLMRDGESIRSVLETSDVLADGRVGKRLTFDARRNQHVRITVESGSFDTFLEVASPSGRIFEDDDSLGNRNSLIEFIAPEAGRFDLIVTSFGGNAVGMYTVSAELGGVMNVLTQAEGRLDATDRTDASGRYVDELSVTLAADRPVTVSVDSADFDTFVAVYGPDGALVAENDDGGTNSNSEVTFSPRDSGRFSVEVTSFAEGGVGDYRLVVWEEAR